MLEHLISLSDAASAAATAANDTRTIWDKLGLGGSVAVLGLTVVFSGLISLIVITLVYPKISRALIAWSSARKENAAAKKAGKVKKEEPAAVKKAAAPAAASKPDSDDALIAVITAAIAASLGTSSNGVVVRKIERTGQNVPSWGARGRIEQVYNRF